MFAFLFSEIVQQLMKREKDAMAQRNLLDAESLARAPPVPDLETELYEMGKPIGERVLELMFYREKGTSQACSGAKREIRIVNMLHFINNQIWKGLFNRPADGLEQSVDDENEYRILDRNPVTNRYISVGGGGPSCASFIAGIIEGILKSCNMDCIVRAHQTPNKAQPLMPNVAASQSTNLFDENLSGETTIYIVKFT